MDCKIDGCGRSAVYTGQQVCQKHYFRFWRNGSYELKPKTRKYRTLTPNGYFRVYEPGSPLCDPRGYVFEHRHVVYEKYGDDLPDCEVCGAPTSWDTCHIDHIDRDRTNNKVENLRPLCRPCNTNRDRQEYHLDKGNYGIEFGGEIKTPEAWSRDDRVEVSAATIRRRKSMGMSDYDALFSKKLTHNGNCKGTKG